MPPISNDLTFSQKKVFNAIKIFIDEVGYPPTMAELSSRLNISATAVREHIIKLHRKCAIKYTPHISRGIELLNNPSDLIPIYGRVPAGHPFMSEENIVESLSIKKHPGRKNIFGLIVSGDSMIETGISTGDIVLINPDEEIVKDKMVVALVDGQPTLKWYKQLGQKIKLVPANKKYKPIEINNSDEQFKIIGVVVGWLSSKLKN